MASEAGARAMPDDPETGTGASCPIVGIGASAGGIDALRRLFPKVESGCGMAFIVVQHLDPHHASALAEILARCTSVPVTQIEDESMVEPDHVYVIPPNASLTIRNGRLLLASPSAPRGHRNPIDELFISLAHDQAENAACVILSGTGSDGTLGLRAIKEHGGLTVAQAEAQYDGMMRSAVATGLVDFILRAEDIPAKLVTYFRHITQLDREKGRDSVQSQAADHLQQITALLRARTGHDFSDYKDRTIVRRVQRRMHVLQIDEVPEFIERLRHEPREVTLLFHDLLIGVTNFFRDPDAFEALEKKVIPELFKAKGPDETVRVWVPGCATGEEAYSIAMLLRDNAPRTQSSPKLQVFATDIDEHALEAARLGRYPAAILKDVSTDRLDRYFVREDGTYRVGGDLRELCLFSLHNLLRDAPFSKLDLISCRNLLIYLNGHLQDRVIPLFHYALNPNGYMFLGTSENVTRHSRLFFTVDKSNRIFRRRAVVERRLPEFPLSAPTGSRRTVPVAVPHGDATEPSLKALAERQLLDRFAPAYVVINAEGEVLQSSGRTGKYLELPAGAPDTNIFNLARTGLRLDLRAALHKAIGSGQLTAQTKVSIGVDGGRQEIDLYIQPLRIGTPPDTLYMIVFQDLGAIKPIIDELGSSGDEDVEGARVRQLEAELRATKERLQTTTEELDSSNEELKSSNEELQSINEELQSTNEELETSKEELQSINEELQTVNAELNARVEELSRANNDMSNLLESTQIATVFLDRALVVKGFTPAAKDVFHLIESDVGRPIMHVRARFGMDNLQDDAERVLRTLATIERPVRSTDSDTRYVMRMLPYRTADNVIGGVVITFTDITRISAAEARIEQLAGDLRERIGELETLLDLVPVGVILCGNGEGKIQINSYGARLLGIETGAHGLLPVSISLRLLEDGTELPPEEQPLQKAARTGEVVPDWRGQLEDAKGRSVHVFISATPLVAEDGMTRGAIAAIVDMSRQRHAEEQRHNLLHELQHRVKNILATVNALATRMARTHRSVESFQNAFLSRLSAMGRVHDLLSSGAWSGADLRSLVEAAVEPFTTAGIGNVQLTGGEIRLNPNAAAALGMVLHELVTNAAKHGALSTSLGRIEIEVETSRWRRTQ